MHIYEFTYVYTYSHNSINEINCRINWFFKRI